MDSFVADLRHALRGFLRRPGFALLVVAVLALGLGANALVFTVVDAVLLRPLPLPASDELVQLWNEKNWFSKYEVDVMAEHAEGLRLGGYYTWGSFGLDTGGQPQLIEGSYVTADYFDVLGVEPLKGRFYRPGEDRTGAPELAVISESLWRNELGADPDVVGGTVRMDGQSVTVVGVAPSDFGLPRPETRIWRPLVFDPADDVDYQSRYVQLVARVDPGVGGDPARRLAEIVGPIVAERDGQEYADLVGPAVPLRDALVGEVKPTLLALLVGVGAVLLVVTVNVANLLLARAAGRRRELAVRSAMGCDRRRLVTLLGVESLALAAAGGLLGTALAAWASSHLPRSLSSQLPRLAEIAPDARLLGFGAALSLVTALLFGALPAWRMARADLFPALREGAAGGLGRSRVHGALVVAEVALAFVLVAAAGLVGRSFWTLVHVDPGFRSDGIVSFRPIPPPSMFDDFALRKQYFEQLEDRLAALPGVDRVGASHMVPVADRGFNGALYLAGEPEPEEPPIVNWRVVTPGYFDTLGIPLLRGRAPSRSDADGAVEAVWVNRTFADHFLGAADGTDPIGRRFRHGIEADDQWLEVMGVVGDVHQHGLEQEVRPEVYRTLAQVERPVGMAYFLHTDGDPAALFGPIRQTVAALDADVVVSSLETMDRVLWTSITRPRLTAALFAAFAILTLLLAAVGIYGVVAYEVGQRVREIGLRMALGSDRRSVIGLVVGQTLRRTGAGLLLGLGAALLAGRWLASLLFQVEPHDPTVLAAVALVLSLVACLSALRPALRAAGVDPLEALRQD